MNLNFESPSTIACAQIYTWDSILMLNLLSSPNLQDQLRTLSVAAVCISVMYLNLGLDTYVELKSTELP